jgi:hypothetical protein
MDGSCRLISAETPVDIFKALCTRAGGEAITGEY